MGETIDRKFFGRKSATRTLRKLSQKVQECAGAAYLTVWKHLTHCLRVVVVSRGPMPGVLLGVGHAFAQGGKHVRQGPEKVVYAYVLR